MIQIASLKGRPPLELIELIGSDSDEGKIVGVDNKPHKQTEGIWIVTAKTGEQWRHHRMDK